MRRTKRTKTSDEQTEVDEDEYEDAEETNATERDNGDIDATYDIFVRDDDTVDAIGTVHNVSEDTIDAIDITLQVSDADGESVGTQTDTVRSLEPDGRHRFEISMTDDTIHGDPDDAELDITIYDHN